jgi:hypothetical protein
MDDTVEVSLNTLGIKKFQCIGTLYSVGKTGKNGEEWRLVTFHVTFMPKEGTLKFRRKNSYSFSYQILVEKSQSPG